MQGMNNAPGSDGEGDDEEAVVPDLGALQAHRGPHGLVPESPPVWPRGIPSTCRSMMMGKRKVMVGPTWPRPPAGRPGPWGMAGGTRAGPQHRRSLRV